MDRELTTFVETLTTGFGRPERRTAMAQYITGLLLDGERKSIEPIAARLVDHPDQIQAMRQRLQQCVVVSPWEAGALCDRLAGLLDRELPEVTAFVIDDTGFPKKGRHSVGVARQYSGTLGRTDNCQIATSLHLAGERGSACIGMRLYLPETWTSDRARCRAVGVPDTVAFGPKWQHALALLDAALSAGVRRHVVLGDAAFGEVTAFRAALTARGLAYVLRVPSNLVVWPPGTRFVVPAGRGTTGRPRSTPRPATPTTPLGLAALAATLPHRRVAWREGSRGRQASRFAAVRVRLAHRHAEGAGPGPEVWLLSEWPRGEPTPTKYYLSSLPATTALRTLVAFGKLRWRIERDYQELKGELGLDHFEGRTWNGFHHHVALCAAAHAFLALRRALFPSAIDAVDDRRRAPTSAILAVASPPAMSAMSPVHQRRTFATRAVTNVIK
ncbi:MAG: IS701 family transposase [Actinobacteria bacterium]|nr:IS701 family transposase [Actinomycetota bacterium]